MRFWKITEPSLFEKAQILFDRVLEGANKNHKIWEEIVPFKFHEVYTQNGFNLCATVVGVVPADQNAELPVGWRRSKDRGVIPDGRRKEGRVAQRTINDSTVQVAYTAVHNLLGVHERYGRFTIPQILRSVDKTEFYAVLDDKYDLKADTRLEEVTRSYVETKLEEA